MSQPAATDAKECTCDLDSDWWACLDGRVFGPCEAEYCYGVCEFKGDCDHECHREVVQTGDANNPDAKV